MRRLSLLVVPSPVAAGTAPVRSRRIHRACARWAAVLCCAALCAQGIAVPRVSAASKPRYATSLGDPVLYWNAVALQAMADDHSGVPEQGGPGSSSRALAIVHVAVYDAVNSIDRTHEPYIAAVPLPRGVPVSMDAAVAAAAFKTLTALYPAQRQKFDLALREHTGRIPKGFGKNVGLALGETAAARVLQARAADGSAPGPDHAASILPGRHRKDPMNPGQPFMGANWGSVKPFVLASSAQFRSPPPPDIASSAYAEAFNEIKAYGGDGITTPTIRTPDQTRIGLFWAYDGTKRIGAPPRLYNQIARVIAVQKRNTVPENARLFALINLAQADAGIVCWESKYVYDFWRPVVAIREADAGTGPSGLGDGNPLTSGDPSWTPLGAPMSNMTMNNFTPPFPAYPSGHATFGAATFRVLERFYGTDAIPFTFVSDELNGVTTDNTGVVRPYAPRSFRTLSQANEENGLSRIYLGVHWRFDVTEGWAMGKKVGDAVYDGSLRALPRR